MNGVIDSDAVRATVDRVCGPWDRTDGPGLAIGVMLEDRILLRRGYGLADNINPFALGRTHADALFDRRLAVRPPGDLLVPPARLAGRYRDSRKFCSAPIGPGRYGRLRSTNRIVETGRPARGL